MADSRDAFTGFIASIGIVGNTSFVEVGFYSGSGGGSSGDWSFFFKLIASDLSGGNGENVDSREDIGFLNGSDG